MREAKLKKLALYPEKYKYSMGEKEHKNPAVL